LLELGEREKVKLLGFELLRRLGSTDVIVSKGAGSWLRGGAAANLAKMEGEGGEQAMTLHRVSAASCQCDHAPQLLLDKLVGILVPECDHAATRVLDEHNLMSPKQLLGNNDTAQAVNSRSSSLKS
jgi:hypothetical protein